jgi:hypothetical protein
MDFSPEVDRTCLYPKIQLDAVIDAMAWQAMIFMLESNAFNASTVT